MLYHEGERKNKENSNFLYIVYLLAKLCNIFDGEFFFIDVSINYIALSDDWSSLTLQAYRYIYE